MSDISSLINHNIRFLDTIKPPFYLGGPLLPFMGKSFLGTISDPSRQKALDEYDRRKSIDQTTPYPTAPFLRVDF